MDIFAWSERLMSMDDDAWARHANPWSVYSRLSCLPLIALAIWSRAWIGYASLLFLAAALVWTWLNPRLFSAPRDHQHWAARGVHGERRFLDRHQRPIPAHHQRMAYALTALSALGLLVLIYGLIVLDGWATVCGLVLTILPKLWFVDRMVWLDADMRDD